MNKFGILMVLLMKVLEFLGLGCGSYNEGAAESL